MIDQERSGGMTFTALQADLDATFGIFANLRAKRAAAGSFLASGVDRQQDYILIEGNCP